MIAADTLALLAGPQPVDDPGIVTIKFEDADALHIQIGGHLYELDVPQVAGRKLDGVKIDPRTGRISWLQGEVIAARSLMPIEIASILSRGQRQAFKGDGWFGLPVEQGRRATEWVETPRRWRP